MAIAMLNTPEFLQTCRSRLFFTQNINYLPDLDVLYLNNAKAGCTTVKEGLIRAAHNSAQEDLPPMRGTESIHKMGHFFGRQYDCITEKTFTFSMVRNPFVRILSAYIDKVLDTTTTKVDNTKVGIIKEQLFEQNGWQLDDHISFEAFLFNLDPTNTIFDQHWRPQVSNILINHIKIDYIAFLESFDSQDPTLLSALKTNEPFRPMKLHSTAAHNFLQDHLTPRATKRILELYHDDFETFGYSRDPNDFSLPPKGHLADQPRFATFYDYFANDKNSSYETERTQSQLNFEEKFIIASEDHKKELAEEIRIFIKEDNAPAHLKFPALHVISDMARPMFSAPEIEHALRCQIKIAPYFPGKRVELIKMLIARDEKEEAHYHINRLRKTSWQGAIADRLEGLL